MKYVMRVLGAVIIFLAANIPILAEYGILQDRFCAVVLGMFLFINIKPTFANQWIPSTRIRVCANGCELLIQFLISATVSFLVVMGSFGTIFHTNQGVWVWNVIFVFLMEGIAFLNGIIRVYVTSKQLGMKWRVLGVIFGLIPIVNLFMLWKILDVACWESAFEGKKLVARNERAGQKLCETKYPLLMVHGIFFRDFKYFNYWGRIPEELEAYGATIYYGNHQSAAAVAECGEELAERIKEVLKETGAEKVNVIAHSKGGLDTRYAISKLGMAPYVASLTTINTPHRGCIFADYLLNKLPEIVKHEMDKGYNVALHKLGDPNPNFLAGVSDLTATACAKFNEEVIDSPDVYYQSVGSKLNFATGGRFPLNFSHELVEHFDGDNDGLVAEGSFPWGDDFTFLTTKGRRGISHGDMIDLNREDIRDFDVREFFVQLVYGLKQKGF